MFKILNQEHSTSIVRHIHVNIFSYPLYGYQCVLYNLNISLCNVYWQWQHIIRSGNLNKRGLNCTQSVSWLFWCFIHDLHWTISITIIAWRIAVWCCQALYALWVWPTKWSLCSLCDMLVDFSTTTLSLLRETVITHITSSHYATCRHSGSNIMLFLAHYSMCICWPNTEQIIASL